MVADNGFDLPAYLTRIGFDGVPSPDLSTLRQIQSRHVASIPFENLDPLFGRPVSLDLGDLQRKLVQNRRGGYCFEQNAVLRAALEAIGFSVTSLIARVVWMAPPDAPVSPRSHMLLKVSLPDGDYLADAGFGGHLLGAPLRLLPDLEQETPNGILRLVQEAGVFTLQTRLPAGWFNCYRFTEEPAHASDYMVSNWFTSTHPDSRFRNGLMAERLTQDARLSLFNLVLTVRHRDGRVDRTHLETPVALAEVLDTMLHITPPIDVPTIFERLSSIPER